MSHLRSKILLPCHLNNYITLKWDQSTNKKYEKIERKLYAEESIIIFFWKRL